MEASAVWEIVDLGANSWEVVVGDAPAVREVPAGSNVEQLRPAPAPAPAAQPRTGWRAHTERRVAALERRVGELDHTERRVSDLEDAQVEIERGLDKRDAALREEIEEIYRHAQRRLSETDGKPGWIQRRHERRLARLERDRQIRTAEQRLAERSRESLARIEDEGRAAEQRARAARGDERRLLELTERIDAAEARLRSADERIRAARSRALDHGPIDL